MATVTKTRTLKREELPARIPIPAIWRQAAGILGKHGGVNALGYQRRVRKHWGARFKNISTPV